jgi:CDP-diacylglycerol---serine O-phosphatidyltransferase
MIFLPAKFTRNMRKQASGFLNPTVIPNLITLCNLLFGCIAVVLALEGQLANSALLIVLCSFLDFLDGTAARLLNARSEIGKQLDSLADLVSFGFAPSAIAYSYIDSSLAQEGIIINGGIISLVPYLAFLITLFSAVRLARFNIDSRQSTFFIGLPTPANALLFASIPLVLAFSESRGFVYHALNHLTSGTSLLIAMVLIFSILLVAPIKMFSLKFKNLRWRENKIRMIFISASLLLVMVLRVESLPLIMTAYILLSFITHVFCKQHDDTAVE